MTETAPIDFWFSVGSTYTYLAVMRVPGVERATGVRFRWRPFSVRTITREIGNSPFRGKPVKLRYMWRDLERRAALYGIPIRVPAPYPLRELDFANRVAVVGAREGWCADYVRATYRRWFQDGLEAGVEPNLSESLREVGQEPRPVLDAAAGDEVGRAYAESTDAARRLGVFGAPTFAVGDELFWGDDRLEDAVSWHRHGRVQRLEPGQPA